MNHHYLCIYTTLDWMNNSFIDNGSEMLPVFMSKTLIAGSKIQYKDYSFTEICLR
jgi:hypothetical protein